MDWTQSCRHYRFDYVNMTVQFKTLQAVPNNYSFAHFAKVRLAKMASVTSVLNPFTAPACKISGLESAHKNNIADVPITNLLSIQCTLIEILPCAHAKVGKKEEKRKKT